MIDLERELAAVINKHSLESASNTPDFILAKFLIECLAAWDAAMQKREEWSVPKEQARQ